VEVPLTVATDGSGEGTVWCKVESDPLEECEAEAEYPKGTKVVLSPEAELGSEFTGWSGDCTGVGACELTMNEDKSVMATFELEEFELTVKTNGNGEGVVECEVDNVSGPCLESKTYPYGTTVILYAEEKEDSEFVEWGGDCSGVEAECELTIEEPLNVTATFSSTAEYALKVDETGSGLVTSFPAGINCGIVCENIFLVGTKVTLTATPAKGSVFNGWGGGVCKGIVPCTVTITGNTTVAAEFEIAPIEEEAPEKGMARVAGTALVKGGKAALKLACSDGPCKGTLKLTAKIKRGKKTKSLVIGKASFDLEVDDSTTLKVKLSGPAKQELAKGRTLKAKVGGSGVSASTVKLKQAKK
jgi:hypothetical protein